MASQILNNACQAFQDASTNTIKVYWWLIVNHQSLRFVRFLKVEKIVTNPTFGC